MEAIDVVRRETNAKFDGLVCWGSSLAREPRGRRGAVLVKYEFGGRERNQREESEELRLGQHRERVSRTFSLGLHRSP